MLAVLLGPTEVFVVVVFAVILALLVARGRKK